MSSSSAFPLSQRRSLRRGPLSSRYLAQSSRRAGESAGFGITEPLVLLVLLMLAMSGTGLMMASIASSATRSARTQALEENINSDLASIRQLSERFTCCSGTCTTTPPTSFGTATSSCATNDPRDDRYFFPQRDDPGTTTNLPGTTTPREPDAVDQLCDASNNTAFLTPLKTAIDALPVPAGATRTTTIQPARLVRITYTDTALARTVRVAQLMPPMGLWCP